MSLGLASPTRLLDIGGLSELDRIRVRDDIVEIGALTRHARLAGDHTVAREAPVLARAAGAIGHVAIRNRGTLGGSLAHADPAAELPAALLALGATVVGRSARGTRRIPMAQFLRGPYSSDLAEDELLVAVEVPRNRGVRYGFAEFAARHGDYARAGAVARLALDASGRVQSAGAVLFAVAGGPLEIPADTAGLVGSPAGDVDWFAVARAVVPPELGDRARLARTMLARALREAAAPTRPYLAGAAQDRATRLPARSSPTRRVASGDRPRRIALVVNGRRHQVEVAPRLTLADLLRERLRLYGTRLGCEQGVCGACTVLVDGVSTRSCLMLAVQADGSEVRTVEGLADRHGSLHPLQAAFDRHDALQCGFCTPGFLMAGVELLAGPPVDEDEVRSALSGNLCRCTGYGGIVDAVLETQAAAAGPTSPQDAHHGSRRLLLALTAAAAAAVALVGAAWRRRSTTPRKR
jgi:xanthine dehydrogenase iron-sulfur cluster and FAD-binding subunit A